jgi:hypothetical protein
MRLTHRDSRENPTRNHGYSSATTLSRSLTAATQLLRGGMPPGRNSTRRTNLRPTMATRPSFAASIFSARMPITKTRSKEAQPILTGSASKGSGSLVSHHELTIGGVIPPHHSISLTTLLLPFDIVRGWQDLNGASRCKIDFGSGAAPASGSTKRSTDSTVEEDMKSNYYQFPTLSTYLSA